MTEPTPLLVPRENVNDESATLVAWLVADGTRIDAGQTVAQVETSKAVADIAASFPGILRHKAKPGEDVPVGGVLGWVAANEEAVVSTQNGSAPAHVNGDVPLSPSVRRLVSEEKVDPDQVKGTGRGGRITKADVLAYLTEPPALPAGVTRLSRKARELAREQGLDESAFAGRGLVRSRDLKPAPHAPSTTPVERSRAVAASGVPTHAETLSRAKRTEAKYLRSGFETTLASAVSVACPTRGFREAAGASASAVIVFEAARLLKKYPAFNAYHDEGKVYYYDEVNVGFAVDAGRGLKVPVLRGADTKGVAAIAAEMRDLVVAYLDDALPVSSLAGGTFTLTDLSGEGVTAFHPLINQGQSAILGVCAEVLPPGGGLGSFQLTLAFDHQLAEGRTAARFLGELRDRLAHYESTATRDGAESSADEPRCARCQTGYHELAANGHSLLQSVRADGSVRLICKLCFEGWV